MIALWNDGLGWAGITNSVIPDHIAPWEAHLLELTLFDQAYPELQIASVQAQMMGTFSPNMDRVENKDVMNMCVFCLHGTFLQVTCNTMEHFISFEPADT